MYTDVVTESLSFSMYRHEMHVSIFFIYPFFFLQSMLIFGLFCLLFSLGLSFSLCVQEDDDCSLGTPDYDCITDNGLLSRNEPIRSKVSKLTEKLRKRYPTASAGPTSHSHTSAPCSLPAHPPPPTLTQWHLLWLPVMPMTVQKI